ncbi:MAG TPA: iron-sulfur cluster assembly accessory protein [Phycisphaerae bacterium]|nr:iron-sulfur cluster assembly accessory protein [Phycisphaerae bacterium]
MAISLTERAAEKITTVFESKSMPAGSLLRVGIKGGGCSGFSYIIDVTDKAAEEDEIFTSFDVSVCCDPKSYLYLNGTEIDYEDDLLKGGFVFKNPNASESCHCGASFSV